MAESGAKAENDQKLAAVRSEVERDVEKAQQFKILDADIERARKLVGVDTAFGGHEQSWVGAASPSAIKRFAWSVGDDNPLYFDPSYGPRTRWGAQIAPGSMAQMMKSPLFGDPMDPEHAKLAKGLFRGVHVFVSGAEKIWYRPVFVDDVLRSYSGYDSVEEKQSEFAGRSVIRYNRYVRLNQRGEINCVTRVRAIFTERKAATERGKYSAIEPALYTDEDIAKIDAIYAAETRRGAEPRYWEDVEIGEKMPPMVKGPLTVTDMVLCHAGGYGVMEYGLGGGRLWWKNRNRVKNFYIKDERGVPDVAQRVHWDPEWARKIGNPMPYDYSVLREGWLHHYLTDWVGDDGWVFRQYDEMRKFNYVGDAQFLEGEVVAKREEAGRFFVDLNVRMVNQRGTLTTTCEATVLLPSRSHGPVILPEAPFGEQEKAARMWARHGELIRENPRLAFLT